MRVARYVLTAIGVLAVVSGLIWIGQGTGVFPYPAYSFMIDQTPWVWRGGVLAVIGLAVIWAARRFLR
jgi:hypothetical protein